MGCLDYETGQVYMEEHEKYDAEVFLSFLKNVLQRYPSKRIVIITVYFNSPPILMFYLYYSFDNFLKNPFLLWIVTINHKIL